jgi:aspartate beta-hydroxylase
MTQAAAQVLRQSAKQLTQAGDFTRAEAQIRAAIALAPGAPILHLEHGQIFEQQNNIDAATRAYYRAVMKARAKGLWLDDASVPAQVLPQVLHAMQFVEKHRDSVLLALLDPLYAQFGKTELKRVTQALNIYLGLDQTKPASPHQRPLFLYVPGLTETPFIDAKRFNWVPAALDARAAIAAEAHAVFANQHGVEPFLQAAPGEDLTAYLAGDQAKWDAHFFYRHGLANLENLNASPATANLLAQLPLVRIAEHAPEICFSALTPGSHILAHTGVTNLRLVAHLPLILPDHCALKVAGVERAWKLDEVLIFDDTFEHEAWNRSNMTRIILLMDAWHPDLTQAEQIAFAELIEGIGGFNRG